MKKLFASVLAVTLTASLCACGGGSSSSLQSAAESAKADIATEAAKEEAKEEAKADQIVLKLGHMGSETNPMMRYTYTFRDKLEELTDGGITIEVYGDKVLGTDREMLEQVQSGTLDMSINTTSVLSNFIPEYAALDLPYLLSGWDHCYKFMDSDVYTDLLAEGADSGITTLSLAGRGFRHVTTNDRPIRNLDDIKGLKIRVIESSVYVDAFNAFGANPQAMSFGEVITALQQGTIDGHENSYAIIQQEHVDEVQNMISETAHMFAFFNLVINTELLEGMSDEYQAAIREAALYAGLEETKAEQADEKDVKEDLISKGVTVIEDVDIDQFKSVVQPVYDNFGKENDLKYLEAIQGLE